MSNSVSSYKSYLRKIANEVDELISKPQNKGQFVKHTDRFVKMFYTYKAAVKEFEERIECGKLTDNFLSLYDTLKDAFKGLPTNIKLNTTMKSAEWVLSTRFCLN